MKRSDFEKQLAELQRQVAQLAATVYMTELTEGRLSINQVRRFYNLPEITSQAPLLPVKTPSLWARLFTYMKRL